MQRCWQRRHPRTRWPARPSPGSAPARERGARAHTAPAPRPGCGRDVDEMFALHADPRVWRHLPSGRHESRARTEGSFAAMDASWVADGLGYWSVRRREDGEYLGVCGCAVPAGRSWWNLYYRFRPEAQGHGFAVEAAATAIATAQVVRPGLPVVAFLLENNAGSRRTAERAGLRLRWRGPDAGNPDPAAVRLVFSDRPFTAATLLAVLDHY
ncbi:GNAT family N-acetyltransferase [Jatrophihabitans sp. YIM 134969]